VEAPASQHFLGRQAAIGDGLAREQQLRALLRIGQVVAGQDDGRTQRKGVIDLAVGGQMDVAMPHLG
jgi:hypothetical protein